MIDQVNELLDSDKLIDPFNRHITYLRLSVTDRCDLRCTYCMPEKMTFLHKKEILTFEEMYKLCSEFIRLGIKKIRITGGEPLLSKDTWGVMDYIIEEKNPNKNLQLAINSNLGAPDKLIDKFIEKIQRIEDEERVREFIIFRTKK